MNQIWEGIRRRRELIDESVKFENNAMALYRLFSTLFPQDSKFWECLSGEESYHASLFDSLRNANEMNALPDTMLPDNIEKLRRTNAMVERLFEKFTAKPPSREMAFLFALALETSGSARIFQKIVSEEALDKMEKSFKERAGFCKDHHKRIRKWMETNDIHVTGELNLF